MDEDNPEILGKTAYRTGYRGQASSCSFIS